MREELPDRNDIDGAVGMVREYLEAGLPVPDDLGEVLLMLQDDPTELIQRLETLYAEFGVAPRTAPEA